MPPAWTRYLIPIAPIFILGLILAIISPWAFDTSGFTPRTACGHYWTLHLIQASEFSDTVIFMCYMVLSIGLIFWPFRAKEYVLSWRELMATVIWSEFIFACGLTHLTSRLMFTWPAYRLDAVIKVYCAMWSICAVLQLPYLLRLDKKAYVKLGK